MISRVTWRIPATVFSLSSSSVMTCIVFLSGQGGVLSHLFFMRKEYWLHFFMISTVLLEGLTPWDTSDRSCILRQSCASWTAVDSLVILSALESILAHRLDGVDAFRLSIGISEATTLESDATIVGSFATREWAIELRSLDTLMTTTGREEDDREEEVEFHRRRDYFWVESGAGAIGRWYHIERERKNIVMMIAVHMRQSGQKAPTTISWEMTYPLKHIPPRASPEMIFASVWVWRR